MYRRNGKYSKNKKFNKTLHAVAKWLKCFVIFSPEPLMAQFMTVTYTIINRNKDRLFENISQYNVHIMVD